MLIATEGSIFITSSDMHSCDHSSCVWLGLVRLRLYCASGNEVLKSNLPLLTALFEKFADATTPSVRASQQLPAVFGVWMTLSSLLVLSTGSPQADVIAVLVVLRLQL